MDLNSHFYGGSNQDLKKKAVTGEKVLSRREKNLRKDKMTIKIHKLCFVTSKKCMVPILDGNSEIDGYVRKNIYDLICLRHLTR